MAKRRSLKADALQRQGTLNPHPEEVRDALFLTHDFFDPQDLLQVKYEMLRKTQTDGDPVSEAAAAFGLSRPSFYQAQRAFEAEGVPGLLPRRRGPKHGHKLTEAVVTDLEDALAADASLRTADLVRRVEERHGVQVHPRSVERALARRQKKR